MTVFPSTPDHDASLLALSRQHRAIAAQMTTIQNERAKVRRAGFDLAAFRAALPPKLKVLIVTPVDDGHKKCFWDSVRRFERTPDPAGHTYEWITPDGDSLVTRARNNHNHTFLAGTDFDVVGTIDSDLDFRPEDIWQLVAHRLPIVAGTYYIKARDTRPCINSLPGEGVDHDTGLMRVATAGTGALFTHRSVVNDMVAAGDWWHHWLVRYIADGSLATQHHVYHHGIIDDPTLPHTPREMSEDWAFCYFARALGYDIYLDTRAAFFHRGEIDFPLHARRMTAEEVARGEIAQPDGTFTAVAKPERV
jgi:hypothetical protein